MNRGQSDNVYSSIFTPQEYQVELIDACLSGNTMAVLAPKSTQSFLTTMVTRELAYMTRGPSHMHSLILGQSSYKLMRAGEAIQQNSNLAVATYTTPDQVEGWTDTNWENVFNDVKVVVMTCDVLIGKVKYIPFESLNLIIITDAHNLAASSLIREILSKVSPSTRILGLTSSVLNHFNTPAYLESFLVHLEQQTKCMVNTASDIATILRYIHKPQERLIMCSNPSHSVVSDAEAEVRRLMSEALNFLDDHRYDPVETYGEEYAEFCIGVPDPKKEPRSLMVDFINILDNFGLWCADRAALYTLVEIEKLKKKTAYDRHYLLLCLVFSVMAKIRAVIEEHFEDYTELEQITKFSSPKILRLIEILKEVRPRNFVDPRKRRDRLGIKSEDKSKENEVSLCTLCKCAANKYSCLNSAAVVFENNSTNSVEFASVEKSNLSVKDKNARIDSLISTSKLELCNTPEVNLKSSESGDVSVPLTNGCYDASVHIEMICKPDTLLDNNKLKDYELEGSKIIEISSNSLSNGVDAIEDLNRSDVSDSSTLSLLSVDANDKIDCNLNNENKNELNNDEMQKENFVGSIRPCLCSCHVKNEVFKSTSGLLTNELQLPNGKDVYCDSPCHTEFYTPLNEPKEVDDKVEDNDEYMSCEEDDNDVLQIDLSLTNGSKISLISNSDVKDNEVNNTPESTLEIKDGCLLESKSSDIISNNDDDESVVIEDGTLSSNDKFPDSNEISIVDKSDIQSSESANNEINSAVSNPPVSNPVIPGNNPPAATLGFFHSSRSRRRREEVKEKIKVHIPDDPDSVCGLIFVNSKATARIVYRLLKELSDIGGDFSWIFPQYTVELRNEPQETTLNANMDAKSLQAEHKKQEEVLRRFRHHECNLLVSTSVLEFGIDIPHCNLVLRFDPPLNYQSYVHCRGRAKGPETFYYHLITEQQKSEVVRSMATYLAFEKVLLNYCAKMEKGTNIEVCPEEANAVMEPYVTKIGSTVRMDSAIALLNKYCAKLPSDTFTHLTASWRVEGSGSNYRCTIMLPINSPLKGYVHGPWLHNRSLAKMATALTCCKQLHQIGELDDNLLPISKESLQLTVHFCAPPPDDNVAEGMPRPGTTKRRQYYYKRVADCLVNLEPKVDFPLWVYKFDMFLSCPIPEEQNTRGRKIYRPELTVRSLGIITSKPIPQISGFPIFTRSGEVMHNLIEVQSAITISLRELELLQNFHQFTFTQVLRLEKYPIKFHPNNSGTTFYIAPLTKEGNDDVIDWDFTRTIEKFAKVKQHNSGPREKEFNFEYKSYQDAVVMPWYRNQDQPQYFYVAEICSHLTPQSDFPDAGFETFEKYYLTKYDIQIKNLKQPLLDVDHTSGRLNLLTPRHVNRKGVALPTTSEETKRAKRENLQQKQILVPELCTLHPFPSSLWRKAVCLPTILYRINGLLLANQLRLDVAREVGLGMLELQKNHIWSDLDFGWSLADVLSKSRELAKEGKEP